MATRQERARSFGAIAADYDRLRPTPPAAAVDWIVPDNCEVALDLAAGTGLFSRALVGHGVTAEAIPLPDSSVDAVFASSAWHWFDEERAVPEIARVLRHGGRLGVLWTSRDRELEWVRGA